MSAAAAANSIAVRCAGPNCGRLKKVSERWWLMWTSSHPLGTTVLSLSAWDERVALSEAALHICSDQCAAKLLSHFMNNIRKSAASENPPRESEAASGQAT